MTKQLGVVCVVLAACGGESREEGAVSIGLHTQRGRIADVVTDLGYEVEVKSLRMALAHAAFTMADGAVGAETSGDMSMTYGLGTSFIDRVDATLGDYRDARFTFRPRVTSASDPLSGHVAYMVGTASGMPFEAFIDTTDDIVFNAMLAGDVDPLPDEGDEWISVSCASNGILDGIEFATLPMSEGKREIRPGSAAHDRVRAQLFVSDRFRANVITDPFGPP